MGMPSLDGLCLADGKSLLEDIPFELLRRHVLRTLRKNDRKSFRGSCQRARSMANMEVAELALSATDAQGGTLRALLKRFPALKSLVLYDTNEHRFTGELLAAFVARCAVDFHVR